MDIHLQRLQLVIYDATQAVIAVGVVLGTLAMQAFGSTVGEGQWGAFWFVLGFFFRNATDRGLPLRNRARDGFMAGLFIALAAFFYHTRAG